MGKRIDLTGQTFGRLTVIEENGKNKNGSIKWRCKCECGNEVTVIGTNLRNGNTTSCGCLQKEFTKDINFTDLVGKVFGRLTVIKKHDKDKHGRILWLCKCECGNECIVATGVLTSGKAKSCGCLNRELTSKRMSGENHPNYNPNLTEEDRERGRHINGYEEWVYKVKEQANFTCDCCGQRGHKLHSHHLDGYNWCKERRTDITNGVCLCEHCHNEFHSSKEKGGYGQGNNTKEQYIEFKERKQKELSK